MLEESIKYIGKLLIKYSKSYIHAAVLIKYIAVKKLFSLIVLGLVCLPIALFAQTDLEERIGDDIRFPALPFYSYGSGLGLTTPDSTFRLNIRFRMQNRATFISEDNQEDAIDAAVRRLRLRFDGFVGDPRFLYAIQLSFSPGDVGELSDGDNINIIRDAVMFYRPNENWNIAFGQTKLPGNRQRINSSGALQLTDRSINNSRFNIDRDYGFQVYYLNEDTERASWNIKTAVSTGNGRNWTRNTDTRLAYTGKLELFPFGAFRRDGSQFEGDLLREDTPKLLLSGVYHFNKGALREFGQRGNELFEQRDITSLFFDAMVKYRGWSFQTAYMTRLADDPITVNPEDQSDTRSVFAGDGFDFQLSHLFKNNYEVIGRFSTQSPSDDLDTIIPKREQYSVGLTRYIWEHALKLQTELTYNTHSFQHSSQELDGWYLRFQVEIGI